MEGPTVETHKETIPEIITYFNDFKNAHILDLIQNLHNFGFQEAKNLSNGLYTRITKFVGVNSRIHNTFRPNLD